MKFPKTNQYDQTFLRENMMGSNAMKLLEELAQQFRQSRTVELQSIGELQGTAECWNDWLATDNEHAVGDRKARDTGALDCLNMVGVVLKKH